jgi:hypothetical protein
MRDVPSLVIARSLTALICLAAGAVAWLTERYDNADLPPSCKHGIPAHECPDCGAR